MGEVERLNKLLRRAVRGRLEATGFSVVKRWNGMSCMVANVNPRMDWHENNRKAAEEAEYTAELFAAAHNALPALLSQLEEMRERERKLVEALTAFVQQMEDALSSSVLPDGSVFVAGQTDVEIRADGGLTLNQVKALLSQTDEVKSDG